MNGKDTTVHTSNRRSSSAQVRRRTLGFAIVALVLAILACATPGLPTQPQAVDTLPPPPPTTASGQTAPTQASGSSSAGTKPTSQPPQPQQPPPQPPPQSGPANELTLDDPTYGTVSLQAGFTPDPNATSVVSGGPVDASYLGGNCFGYAASPPDLTLQWDGFGFLRIFFVADGGGDTTLIVNDANGNFYCSDDSFGTLDPSVEFGDAGSGRIDIWVGSLNSGDSISGTLYITEVDYNPANLPNQQQPPPPQGTDVLQFGSPTFGTLSLNAGFSNDPRTQAITSGGDVDASYLGGNCFGWAATNPDFRVQWDGFGFLRFFFVADSGDTTLIINDPVGGWHCNDDSFGTIDPSIDFGDAQDGQYDIWVGSFSSGEFISGTLYVTELDYNPSSLP
jgi:hypothetical protein